MQDHCIMKLSKKQKKKDKQTMFEISIGSYSTEQV